MPGIVIVGAQWGDEGKGKITDLLGEQVGDLSLSLIAPLGADDHDSGHVGFSLRGPAQAERAAAVSSARESPESSRASRSERRSSSPYSGKPLPQIATRRETVRSPSCAISSS